MPELDCRFCHVADERIVQSNQVVLAVRDAYPVARGHTLIILRRHVVSFFDATEEEARGLVELLGAAKAALDREVKPAGCTIGINDGGAAGRTVPHLHTHLIPRYLGDVADPRGGVRWVLPEKAVYWTEDRE